MNRRWAGALVIAAAMLLALPALAQNQTGVQRATLMHDGVERNYLYYVPRGYGAAQPLPLVFALHGGFGSGMGMMEGTGFNAVAEAEGFIVVYPDAIRAWNTGLAGTSSRTRGQDDVGFINAIIDRLSEQYAIDQSRLFATGGSLGGMMTFRLACELGDRFAAVVTAIANMPAQLAADCHPGRPLPILMMMSTTDPRMPFDGGGILNLRGDVISAQHTVDFWLQNNRCSADAVSELLPDVDPQDGARVTAYRYIGCASPVEWLVMEGGGHGWPGRPQRTSELLVGKTVQDIDATQVAWAFFSQVTGVA